VSSWSTVVGEGGARDHTVHGAAVGGEAQAARLGADGQALAGDQRVEVAEAQIALEVQSQKDKRPIKYQRKIWADIQNYQNLSGREIFRQEAASLSISQLLSVRFRACLVYYLEEKEAGAVVNLIRCKAENKRVSSQRTRL